MSVFRIIGVALLFSMGMAIDCSVAHAVPLRERDYLPKPEPVDWSTTRVAFEMDGKSWVFVLDWFAYQTQMPLVNRHKSPKGKFLYSAPRDETGKPRELSLVDIYDIINEQMIVQEGLMLFHGERTIAILFADGSWSPPIPRVQLNDLRNRGRTEIVEVVVRLPVQLDALEVGPELKRILGPFGHVGILGDNQLLVRSDVASLRRHLPFRPPE